MYRKVCELTDCAIATVKLPEHRPMKASSFLYTGVLAVCLYCASSLVSSAVRAEDHIQLQRIKYDAWQTKLTAYPPDIVVVDFWATWCVSCIERFPKMIELFHHYHDQGVRFVSMCLDERDDKPAIDRARRFLIKSNATFENYLMDENLMQAFEWLDLIGIPAVIIYDRKGAERFRLTGDNPNQQFTDEDVETAIEQLL